VAKLFTKVSDPNERIYRLREQKKRNDFHNREVIKLTQVVHQLHYNRPFTKVRLS
jgi:hypothetical protein